jgi:non-canonical poly(A) RNA polymerase PAPD5/7
LNEVVLEGVYNTFLAQKYLSPQVMLIQVPIIKFVDTYARIDLDLAFNQTNALQVVKLVKQYLSDMPAVRPLVMILKTVFQNKNLSVPAEGGLGSYSIVFYPLITSNIRSAW